MSAKVISDEVLAAVNQKILERCKLYDPRKGMFWASENSGDRFVHLVWAFEHNDCHRTQRYFSNYKGDTTNTNEMADWVYDIMLRGLHKRLGDKDFERYLAMPFKKAPEGYVLDPSEDGD